MNEDALEQLGDALTEVMNRFRNYFLGPGINMREENVPFRQRDDFQAPLVTVMGHTYGLRLLEEQTRPKKKGTHPNLFLEVSVNVYSNEFQLDRFKAKLKDEYKPDKVARTIKNFMTPRDAPYVKGDDLLFFAKFFDFDLEKDLDVFKKEKKTASKITGMLIDTILSMKYHIQSDTLPELVEDPKLFASAVYLYCLRVFTIAYRKSLTLDERKLLMRR